MSQRNTLIQSKVVNHTSVASSTTVVPILAAKDSRLGATIYNNSTAILTLKLGAGASSSSMTVKLIAAAYWQVPFGYTGEVTGLWASANGTAQVAEFL